MKIRQTRILLAIAMASLFIFNACKQDNIKQAEPVVQKDLMAILKKQGYSINNIIVTKEGYIVEGDLLFTEAQIKAMGNSKTTTEQYRTFNTVNTGAARTITISIGSNANSVFVAALDSAISRYNALSLRLNLTRVSANAEIQIAEGSLYPGVLAQAGFPENGNPFPTITYQSYVFGSSPTVEFVASVLAHELGHCIGLRHTDYYDRNYSCAYSDNSAETSVDAYPIEGTPSYATANSYMLACFGQNVNRPFTPSDIAALQNMYGNIPLKGTYQIINVKSSLLLAISNGELTNGVEALQWSEIPGATEQRWVFAGIGNDTYQIINGKSYKYLAIGGGSTASGESAKQWDYTGGAEQQWRFVLNADGTYTIYNKNSNKVLCISGGSTANGGRAIQWDNLNSSEQRWRIVKVF